MRADHHSALRNFAVLSPLALFMTHTDSTINSPVVRPRLE
jgi:hypothetical protein